MNNTLLRFFSLFIIFIAYSCDRPIVRIPFEITKDLIIIKIKVNNTDSLNFIFDTGQYTATIDSTISDSLNLVHIDSGTVNCTAGLKRYYLTRCNYKLDTLQFDTTVSYISSFKKYSKILKRRIDGIIGYDIFKNHTLYINYDKKYLELYDHRKGIKWDGNKYPLIDSIAPTIEAEIALLNGKIIKGNYVIDSGSNAGITLSSIYTDTTHILDLITDTVIRRYTNTCGISMKSFDGITKSFRIGTNQVDSIPVSLSTAKKGVLAEGRYSGLIGAKVLKYFNVVIDCKNKMAYIKPNNAFYERERKMQLKKRL